MDGEAKKITPLWRRWLCSIGRCSRAAIYQTDEGMGGKCIDCGRLHGWVYRQDLMAYTERKARIMLDLSRQTLVLEQPETTTMESNNAEKRRMHLEDTHCGVCDTHVIAGGTCKCLAPVPVETAPTPGPTMDVEAMRGEKFAPPLCVVCGQRHWPDVRCASVSADAKPWTREELDNQKRGSIPLTLPRYLQTHKINPANDELSICVVDPVGAGGAHHVYEITGPGIVTVISFQNGPIAEAGVNGLTHEALLAILIDRLQCFERGPYACSENGHALRHLILAKEWLHLRTLKRMVRNVEGTSAI